MSSTSDPPNADAERRGPVSIMPATDGIDDDWGAEPEAAAVVVMPAPAKVPAIAQPVVAKPPVEPVRAVMPEVQKIRETPQTSESLGPKAATPSMSIPAA